MHTHNNLQWLTFPSVAMDTQLSPSLRSQYNYKALIICHTAFPNPLERKKWILNSLSYYNSTYYVSLHLMFELREGASWMHQHESWCVCVIPQCDIVAYTRNNDYMQLPHGEQDRWNESLNKARVDVKRSSQ